MKKGGYFVISLDFELMWGMFDKVTIDSYGENVRGVRAAVPELLNVFKHHGIHATWATVGMLMYENADELATDVPPDTKQPQYANPQLSSYRHFTEHVLGKPEVFQYYFAPDVVRAIVDTDGQELASHTFSHYYCLDGGENGEAIFAADAKAMQTAADRFNTTLTSIVFPRNQTTKSALKVCQENGLTCYRGTESHFLYRARTEDAQTNLFIRGCRLLDHYLNLSGHHTYPLPTQITDLINLPASRFFRPYLPRLRVLEPLRLRRIKNAMTHAAKRGEVFHLWWHPHNFGVNRKENFTNLLNVLNHFKDLQAVHGMESKNMRELAYSLLTK